VVVLNINFAGTFGHDDDDAIARVNYTLTLSDQAGDCNGSSQHSRLNPAGGDVKQTGEQNVPVPANQIIELPQITVIKNIDRDGDGTFEDTAAAGEFCFSLDGGSCVPTNSSGQVVFMNVTPNGEHTITETQLDFTQGTYTFDSGSGTNCTFSGSTATATVASGTTATDATCIFNNKPVELAKPTLTTIATPNATVGGPISDTAALSGGNGTLGGMITFTLYGPDDATCSTAIFTDTKPVSSSGGGIGAAISGTFNPSTAGTYRWIASYTGDGNNAGTATACGDLGETSVVVGNHEEPPPQDPTVTTVSCNPPTVQVNQPTTCTATVGSFVVGAPITTPTGTASFFADASTTAFASCTLRATPTTGVASCSVAYRTSTVGVHTITASYPGDSTHVSSTVDTPFPVTVVPAVPGL
jgi:hypothetical protein